MRTKNNRLINFILEFSQVVLVFLGVYSALMCTVASLSLNMNEIIVIVIMFFAAVLFYFLFTVLETFRKGKMYGIIGITVFFLAIAARFATEVKQGVIFIANNFLKQFMTFTGANLSMISYGEDGQVGVSFGTTFVMCLIGVYLIVIISAFFYRRRHSKVFLLGTLPFVIIPLLAGRLGRFSHFFLYLVVAATIIGTRHLRTDATDRRMRQKLSLIMMFLGLAAGGVMYLVVTPGVYDRNMNKLTQVRNTLTDLSSWSQNEVFAWIKAYFNDDIMTYGKIGSKDKVVYTGEELLKVSGTVNKQYDLYLKGYVGDIYESNKWSSLRKNSEYRKELEKLEKSGTTLENWHGKLRNMIGDNVESAYLNIWATGKLRIRNVAFGYGNYVVPYLPTSSFQYNNNGRITTEDLGIDTTLEYYYNYSPALQICIMNKENQISAYGEIWQDSLNLRQELAEFAKKHYLQVPEELQGITEDFKKYVKQHKEGETDYSDYTDRSDVYQLVRNYLHQKTKYTLTPGKTPSDVDSVVYFLTESKKGYCTHYATAAAMLLRSVGIPARYVEGFYVSKETLADATNAKEEISVTDEDLHAWVEVFDNRYGFVPLEVTPGYGNTGVGNSSQNTQQNNNGNNSELEAQTPASATPTPKVEEVPEESMEFEDIDGNEDEPEEETDNGLENGSQNQEEMNPILQVILIIVLILVSFVVIMETQRRVRRAWFKYNLKKVTETKKVLMLHHHLANVLDRKGAVYRGQTMAEYQEEIAENMEMSIEDTRPYVELVFRARFGPGDISREEVLEFKASYNKLRRKAYQEAKGIKKINYMYFIVL